MDKLRYSEIVTLLVPYEETRTLSLADACTRYCRRKIG
jgi:hypothetical protein